MKTEELIRYYKANIEAIEKGLNNDSLSADKKFRLGYTQQALDGYKSANSFFLINKMKFFYIKKTLKTASNH